MKRLKLLIPILLILLLPLASCGYSAEEVESAYMEGYDCGYAKGQLDAHSGDDLMKAFNAGYEGGYSNGFIVGQKAPRTIEQRAEAVENLLRTFDQGRRHGYEKGFYKGYDKGFEDGYLKAREDYLANSH